MPRNQARISVSAFRHNVTLLKHLLQGRELIAVIKANAYSMGIQWAAQQLYECAVGVIAVSSTDEAFTVKQVCPAVRIIVLGSALPYERSQLVEMNVEPVVSSRTEVQEFVKIATTASPLRVHVMIDTGMGRNGIDPHEAVELIEMIQNQRSLKLAGICTHFPEAAEPHYTQRQELQFQAIIDEVSLTSDVLIHACNSTAILCRDRMIGNAVRVGILLNGILPLTEQSPSIFRTLDLQEVWRWVSTIGLVKELPPYHGVSYGSELERYHTGPKPTKLAVVPVGYADGYPISLSNCGKVLIRGEYCPIMGKVTMDYLCVDVSALETVCVGDEVVLIGHQNGQSISVYDLATLAGTIPYDILCGIHGRTEIVYE